MQCVHCHQESPPGAKFCIECGVPLPLACSACGGLLPGNAKFCPQCGQAAGPPPDARARFASPDNYTPTHLAEKILTSRSALEGERKQVTVLFADLKDSMQILAGRDPEAARSVLDPVLERMMEAVHRYEGTVNQVMGDGIMALFGAPVAHEDHAIRASYAALRMQESIKTYAAELGEHVDIPIAIRVGLNSGDVVVRSIGSDLRMDYTAVGQMTHLAARMEQMAAPGEILITGDVMRLVEGYVQVTSLGPRTIKGLQAPVVVYQLIGAEAARSRLQAAAARGFTRFVGREREIEVLYQALERARAGHGEIVALVGDPGVGKSRVVWEFTHSPQTRGWLALDSRSVSYGKATTYLPFIDLLKDYLQIEDRDDARKIREKLTGKLTSLGEAVLSALPALLALLDVPVDDPRWDALDPPQRRQRILEAVKRLLLRQSQIQPLILVFEDLHWVDSETQAVLDSLVESLPAAQILLVVNYRPQFQHTWSGKSYYRQIRIDPLTPASAEGLLESLIGRDPGLDPLKQLLVARTDGNPFFMEEIVRTLVETTTLVGERGAYLLARPVEVVQVPATVEAVLFARIDRLPAEEKRLLQSAAVIGKNVPFALLQAIAEHPEEALRRGLAHLQSGEFLYETGLFPELEYTFKHSLTHDVAYRSLLRERRRGLHANIVTAIESLYPDRVAEHVERLGHHAVQGEVWDKAVTYLRQAGTKAASRSSYREAVTHFEQALVALHRLPTSRDTQEQAVQLHFALRNALLPLGELTGLLRHLRDAEGLAEALGDRRRLGRIAAYMSNYFWWLGDPDEALVAGQRALAAAAEVGDLSLHIFASLCVGQVHNAKGDYRLAAECLRPNVEMLQPDVLRARLSAAVIHLLSGSWLIDCLAELGLFVEGIAIGEEGRRLADGIDHPYSQLVSHMGLGHVYIIKGEIEAAIRTLEPALALCQSSDLPVDFVITASHLGHAYTLANRLDEAIPLLERSLKQAVSVGLMFGHSIGVARLGEATLRAGHREDALRLAEEALDFAREHKERGHEGWVLRLLGEVAALDDPPRPEAAEAAFRAALALGGELHMRPLVARCRLGLGSLLCRTGRRDLAVEELRAAVELLTELQMDRWLPEARAELAAAGG